MKVYLFNTKFCQWQIDIHHRKNDKLNSNTINIQSVKLSPIDNEINEKQLSGHKDWYTFFYKILEYI